MLISHKIRMQFFLSLFYLNGYAQNDNSKDSIKSIIICQSSISYPYAAEVKNISGTVIVAYDIDSNCKFVNVRLVKGIGYGCDEEAINALKKCKPAFTGTTRKCIPKFNLNQSFIFKVPDEED